MKIKLNLIPEYKKKEISDKLKLVKVYRWELEFTFIFIMFIALLFAIGNILKFNMLTNEYMLNPNNIGRYNEFKKYDDEIREMNKRIEGIKKIQDSQIYWSIFLSKLGDLIPEGINITSLSNKDYSINIVGTADNRDNLILLKENLAKDECLSEINLPLSFLNSKENLTFQMDFKIKSDCLSKKNGK